MALRSEPPLRPSTDPDRFLNFTNPGAQEWWYFDAVSDDRRDVLVLIWFAALPFDPLYGLATLRHQNKPIQHPAPRPLDHCAINLNWYRDGRLIAYALNSHSAIRFEHQADPFRVSISGNSMARDERGNYRLQVRTPSVDGRNQVEAELRFTPKPGSEPIERNLGSEDAPHLWMLGAADGRLEGEVRLEGPGENLPRLSFQGRGYHDHNAGVHDLTIAMRRWAWGRVHDGSATHVYYHSEPKPGLGTPNSLWITYQDGRPEYAREHVLVKSEGIRGNLFGVRHGRRLVLTDGSDSLTVNFGRCVDDGPFYRRWVSTFRVGSSGTVRDGVSELLDTRNLHSPWFNWMIPYRLKRPGEG